MRVPRRWSTSKLSSSATAAVVAGGLAIGATACGSTGGFPDPVTTQGDDVISLWVFFLACAVAVTLLIWGLTTYAIVSSILRRKRAKADGTDGTPRQMQYKTRLEIFYTAMPVLLVTVLLFYSFRANDVLTDTTKPAELNVTVIGFQWQWQFNYENGKVVVSGDPEHLPVLMLPVGRTVRFTLTANDVIHSFWVPEFLEKRDLVPGVDPPNQIEVYVKAPGDWAGRCAEYCGFNHWQMQFRVKAVPADEFARWFDVTSKLPQPMVAGGRFGTSTTSSTAVPITAAPPTVTNPPISTSNGTITPGSITPGPFTPTTPLSIDPGGRLGVTTSTDSTTTTTGTR